MERRKTMGFKNDSVYRTRRILCLVIFVLLLSIIVVCISLACRGTCANHGDSHGPVSATPSVRSEHIYAAAGDTHRNSSGRNPGSFRRNPARRYGRRHECRHGKTGAA